MTELSAIEALNIALREELERDERVFVYGEDVGEYGGLFQVTAGLQDKFGEDRVFDTPLSETALGGTAVGAALSGARPVVEIMFGDFTSIIADHLINYAAKMHFNYADDTSVPLVVRTTYGAGDQFGLHHSQSPVSWFQNVPGLKLVAPATPREYRALLKAAIRDNDPVVFLENKRQYDIKGDVPEEPETFPLCRSEIVRYGEDATVVAIGGMVREALAAAENLEKNGIYVEVINPRTLVPLDIAPIVGSVQKTNALATVHEAPIFGGIGGEIAAQIAENALFYLDAPITRIGAPFTPVPFAENLEDYYLPDATDIESSLRDILE
ncbi:alpha-ketoacid dehydrogenase subunit beta [Halorarum salinum]|uniref:Alpha-ketoacid dehydrogenase subunit beta n=1 Tax=Halorarum salinum TaxID=2743089 RepID=A0A7D5L881_9EURY|nr:alpha-ketoacid dehydrogenase subunit beta [Halobaculum salinum]QLG60294.1 alpha-ketoacid dehydrogenase subunit beta [Halobaculum salinum]